MKWLKWQQGRLGSGYSKMLLIESKWLFKFDVYLIKFPKYSYISPHTDPVEKGRHFRLNLLLKKAKEGGEFICSDFLYSSNRIKLFRPDIREHYLTKIIKGKRYIISIGWIRK